MPESLKNILLVMASGKYLVPPEEDKTNEKLWKETWNRLERFLPGFLEELFPSPLPKVPVEIEEKKSEVESTVAVAEVPTTS